MSLLVLVAGLAGCDRGSRVVTSCGETEKVCDGRCRNLREDNANCGACGNVCGEGQQCTTGLCLALTCPGDVLCAQGNVCLGTACTRRSCVGVECPAEQACVDGVCSPRDCTAHACAPGLACSGGQCIHPACTDGATCPEGLFCSRGACVAQACDDGVKNGGEADVDCGGPCAPCAVGRTCSTGADCQTTTCLGGACVEPSCMDQTKNRDETGVDCGGSCPACDAGQGCNGAADCRSGVCTARVCQPASCTDGVKNGAESDVDCGGTTCPACTTLKGCRQASDCATGVCLSQQCQAATCLDGVKNGTETGVDCGGGACAGCPSGMPCTTPTDCASNVCAQGVCTTATCTDLVRNQNESDVDCGGVCGPCPLGRFCGQAADCATRACDLGVCVSCRASSQCTAPDVCLPSGSCGPCTSSSQCSMGTVCVAGVCTACTNSAQCAAGSVCLNGQCGPCADTTQCLGGQVCVGGACSACTSSSQCLNGRVCQAGACVPCVATSECASGQACISGACTACTTSSQCSSGDVCLGGTCAPGCRIGSQSSAAGAGNPMNVCEVCNPTVSTTAWTAVAGGTACGSGMVCSAGVCADGCWLGGAFVASGAAAPGNACLTCQPSVTTAAYSNVANGTSCAAGKVCNQGQCLTGCFIGAAWFLTDERNPANACQSCQPMRATSTWSSLPAGTSCGATGYSCDGAGLCTPPILINNVTTPIVGTTGPTATRVPPFTLTGWVNAAAGTNIPPYIYSLGPYYNSQNGTFYHSGITLNGANLDWTWAYSLNQLAGTWSFTSTTTLAAAPAGWFYLTVEVDAAYVMKVAVNGVFLKTIQLSASTWIPNFGNVAQAGAGSIGIYEPNGRIASGNVQNLYLYGDLVYRGVNFTPPVRQ
ncbi:MAG: hypothetical protein ACOZQL_14710 [Myxococcota bacterium]